MYVLSKGFKLGKPRRWTSVHELGVAILLPLLLQAALVLSLRLLLLLLLLPALPLLALVSPAAREVLVLGVAGLRGLLALLVLLPYLERQPVDVDLHLRLPLQLGLLLLGERLGALLLQPLLQLLGLLQPLPEALQLEALALQGVLPLLARRVAQLLLAPALDLCRGL